MKKDVLLPPTAISFDIHDVDELRELAQSLNWKNDYRPLRAGTFRSVYRIAHLGGIVFSHDFISQAVNIRGESPKGYLSLAIPADNYQKIWLGQALSIDTIAIVHSSQEADLVSIHPYSMWVISVPIDALQAVAQDYGYLLPSPLLQGNVRLIHPPANTMASLRSYLKNLFAMVQTTPEIATQLTMQPLVRGDFLPLLVKALILSEPHKPYSPSTRYQTVKQVEDLVLGNTQKPLTLHDLSKAVHTSPRSLNYTFQECVGMSPMAYLKAQRLNGVWQQLKVSDPKTQTVIEIANQWGFWHMGNFSQDYRKMFGESPSQTLKRV